MSDDVKPPVRPNAPRGIGPAGRKLWRSIVDDLADELEFAPREQAILAAACKQADIVTELEAALEQHGVMIEGAAGQPKLNPIVPELRQARLAVTRLLGELGIPDDTPEPETAASRRARKAANSRWGNVTPIHRGQQRLPGG